MLHLAPLEAPLSDDVSAIPRITYPGHLTHLSALHREPGSVTPAGLLSGYVSVREEMQLVAGIFTQSEPLTPATLSTLETVRMSTARADKPLTRPQRLSRKRMLWRHRFFVLKTMGITLCFLVDLPIAYMLHFYSGTYQLVNLVTVLILYSNALGFALRRQYGVALDLFKTTLHLKAVKLAVQRLHTTPPVEWRSLSTLCDTTAYLQVLKSTFVKKEHQA